MGYVKNEWIGTDERGYSHLDGKVCIDCIYDRDLRTLHRECQTGNGTCDFCEKENRPIASAEDLQKHIMSIILSEYVDIQDSDSPYDSEEGEYFAPNDWASEIVSENLEGDVCDEFRLAIANETPPDECWCERDWAIQSPYQHLKSGWEEFCHVVRFIQRFSFAWSKGTDEKWHPDHTNPALTLEGIGKIVDQYNLIRTVPAGTEICRVRIESNSTFSSTDEIGVPPHQFANSSRMSPAGIPMFYGSADFDTAIQETWDAKNFAECSQGRFALTTDILVVDFVDLPPIPGYWSSLERGKRGALQFLHSLVADISEPIDRGIKEDLHYAPTQIVAEYLTKARIGNHNDKDYPKIHGLVFKSSKTKKLNYALNFVNKADRNMGDIQDDFLELVEVTHSWLAPK